MKSLTFFLLIAFPTLCQSSSSFVDQHHISAFYGNNNSTPNYFILAYDTPVLNPLIFSGSYKMPRAGRITNLFLSGQNSNVQVDVDLLSIKNNSVSVINTIFNNIVFDGTSFIETNDISGSDEELYYEFEKGDQLQLRFSYDGALPSGEFRGINASYIIEWEYTSTYLDIILPTIGTWSVIVLTLILVTLGALGVRQYHRPHSITT